MRPQPVEQHLGGSRDGGRVGDHDVPYVFGHVPRAVSPFPFSTRELARLMVLRSRVRDGLLSGDVAHV